MYIYRHVETEGTKHQIFLHSMPGRYEDIDAITEEMKKLNIAHVICLAPLSEINKKSPHYSKHVRAGYIGNASVSYCPIEDFGIPESTDEIDTFKATINSAKKYLSSGNILVHCGAGIGRTGMFVIALLCSMGFPFKMVLRLTAGAGSQPELDKQLEFCKLFSM